MANLDVMFPTIMGQIRGSKSRNHTILLQVTQEEERRLVKHSKHEKEGSSFFPCAKSSPAALCLLINFQYAFEKPLGERRARQVRVDLAR